MRDLGDGNLCEVNHSMVSTFLEGIKPGFTEETVVMTGRWQRRSQVQTKWLAWEKDYDLAETAVEISRTN